MESSGKKEENNQQFNGNMSSYGVLPIGIGFVTNSNIVEKKNIEKSGSLNVINENDD